VIPTRAIFVILVVGVAALLWSISLWGVGQSDRTRVVVGLRGSSRKISNHGRLVLAGEGEVETRIAKVIVVVVEEGTLLVTCSGGGLLLASRIAGRRGRNRQRIVHGRTRELLLVGVQSSEEQVLLLRGQEEVGWQSHREI